MEGYSNEEIKNLISCPKIISEPPKKEMRSDRGSKRNDMRLQSSEGDLEFSVFMRINEDFSENFSIGLDYSSQDERGTLCLLRFNGPHGGFMPDPPATESHFRYHIHRAKSENIDAGLRAEHGAEVTDRYASFRGALVIFLNEINVINALEYFPELSQPMLPLNIQEKELEP